MEETSSIISQSVNCVPCKLVGDSQKAAFGSNVQKLDHAPNIFYYSKPSPETLSTVYVKSLQMEEQTEHVAERVLTVW